jgi:hypothetical protein
MASRESEPRQSMGPPQSVKGAQETRKEPNPHTDYRQHFNRTKQRFDVVTAVSARHTQKGEMEWVLTILTGPGCSTERIGQS